METMPDKEVNTESATKTGLLKPSLNAGFITGVGLIALSLIIYLLGLMEVTWLSYLSWVILLAGIILGTKHFRDELNGGFISYGKALGFGTLVALFASLLGGIFTFIFFSYLAPDALEQLRDAAEIGMIERDPNATDQQIEFARMMVNPVIMMIGSIFSMTFVGFVFSLITSAFLKKKDALDG